MFEVIIFILILSLLVVIHELGHFFAAKWAGVKVEEFGVGYPPRAITLFKWKGTPFTLNWIPFGGFVRLAGDDAETIEKDLDSSQSYSAQSDSSKASAHQEKLGKMQSKNYRDKSRFKRMVIILAGATVNILFGMFAFTLVYSIAGIPDALPYPEVEEIAENSPAQEAKLELQDQLLKVADQETRSAGAFISEIGERRGQTVLITISRDGQERELEIYVRNLDEIPEGQGAIGVVLTDFRVVRYPWYIMIPKSIELGVRDSLSFAGMILSELGKMASRFVQTGETPAEIAGPVGIVHMAQRQEVFDQGPLVVLNFSALLSINLGVMNLLPIPALDGGRAMFIILEGILGKKRRARWELRANMAGMILLLGLILLISVNDVVRIFTQ